MERTRRRLPAPSRTSGATGRTRVAGAIAAAVCSVVAIAACGGGGGFAGPTPVATLSTSPSAKASFDAIRSAWSDRSRPPAELRTAVDTFLVRYPRDGLVPLARVFQALIALRQEDFATADAALSQTEGIPPGTTRDFWTIARAKRLRLAGRPDEAIALLRPDIGKEVDPLARTLFQEELTLTALATHRDYEAVSYMDAWLHASSDEERDDTRDRVSALVEKLPKEVLIGALQAMRAQRASLGYGAEIERILAERLVHIATANDDAELARLLMDTDTAGVVLRGDAGSALGELATSRRGLNVVDGRTVGLLLPTASAELRDEAASMLRGFMWAFGLPRGAAAASAPSAAGAGGPAPLEPCSPPSDAPAPVDSAIDDATHFLTRNDSGGGDRTEAALDELAGEGASVIVAGLDAEAAARALRWSERHGVAVVTLVAADDASPAAYGFQAGEPRARVLGVLDHAAPALGGDDVATVVDDSEIGRRVVTLDGGATPLSPPVSCDATASSAGESRFPLALWDHRKTAAWVVSGSAECATDLVHDLTGARARGVVGLTLEAAALPAHGSAVRVVTAQAGVVPAPAHRDPRSDDVHRFEASSGPIDWWTALGRDVSTLARIAVRSLPVDTASDPAVVRERRTRARDALASAQTRLWTTEASGWSRDHVLPRAVCAVEVPAR
jgi:hypothetical protein